MLGLFYICVLELEQAHSTSYLLHFWSPETIPLSAKEHSFDLNHIIHPEGLHLTFD